MAYKSIRTIILENELQPSPLKPRDLAVLHGLKQSSIHRARVKLRHEGLLKSSYHMKAVKERVEGFRQGKRIAPIPLALKAQVATWGQKELEDVLSSPVMTEKERLEKLSLMARFGPDAISIAAIKALEELGRSKGTSAGPPKPLTEDEAIARLGRLLLALGREVSERAFRVTFPEKVGPEATLEVMEANESEFPQTVSEEHPGTPPSNSNLGGLQP